MSIPKLTFAVNHYDRFVPFFDGSVRAEGIALDIRHVGQESEGRYGRNRHSRILQGEFDLGELSLSSYIMARSRKLPFTAISIFPRRLFSQSQIWINAESDVRLPRDLAGRKVGLNSFQTTLSVLAKGDLQSEYSVPWRSMEWVISGKEAVSFNPEQGVVIRRAPEGVDLGSLLLRREIDAVFSPHPPRQALERGSSIQRLFPDPRAEEARYFKKRGFFPIMHVVAFRDDVLGEHPHAARAVLDAYKKADDLSAQFYTDPNWSRFAWGRLNIEDEQRSLGDDLWPGGLRRNRSNLEQFIEYSRDQGLIDGLLSVEGLFFDDAADV